MVRVRVSRAENGAACIRIDLIRPDLAICSPDFPPDFLSGPWLDGHGIGSDEARLRPAARRRHKAVTN